MDTRAEKTVVQSAAEKKVERVIGKLQENAIDAKPDDVIVRNLYEYLLLKEYRERRLDAIKEKVHKSLKSAQEKVTLQ